MDVRTDLFGTDRDVELVCTEICRGEVLRYAGVAFVLEGCFSELQALIKASLSSSASYDRVKSHAPYSARP